MAAPRSRKVEEQVQRILAPLIPEVLPKGMGMVTVSRVKVSRDLAHAKVFVTVLGGEPGPVLRALEGQAGALRQALARALPLRRVPRLAFAFDPSVTEGIRLSKLIEEVSKETHGEKT